MARRSRSGDMAWQDECLRLLAVAAGSVRTDPDEAESCLSRAIFLVEEMGVRCPRCRGMMSTWCRACADDARP